ncbi:antitoxin VapB family protein [Methanocaldococcus jannaschii]|nr:antitoxin VapB family protein [Methanocaldococcus jannaschii]
MATITIDDDVYKELLKLKGRKSVSEFIKELLEERKRKNLDVFMIAFGSRSEEDVEKLKKELKEAEKWMQSLIQV